MKHIGNFHTANFFRSEKHGVYVTWNLPGNSPKELDECATCLFTNKPSETLEDFIAALRQACTDPKDRVIEATKRYVEKHMTEHHAKRHSPEGQALIAALEALP